jgi:hypothetical protein
VPSGLFHDFHQAWSIEIRNALNRGLMPKGYYALVEQKVDGPEPDVIAVEKKGRDETAGGPPAAVLTTQDGADLARRLRRGALRAAGQPHQHPAPAPRGGRRHRDRLAWE